ncbi:CPBP family intramembrane glutamic endopeptidase [Microbacterium amylolyticum]|uniref:Membrane protease YdiL (CAAX protease family) n=1 Tax=Microbacterium amylolyticum TaxID=936337 RepID=A0ABS4ZFM1_9MICO|nr:CPBP family intramembrane glutamic endopeptidase [Microbacterium amylolyticum]MBP2436071.1 membrane protease YdiL (CAAX protease family) [Microbacterium amylolyticum]
MLDYSLLVLPGLLLIGAAIVLARPERDLLFRVMLLILGFVLIRDAMTPAGFWEFGASNGVPWLRFTDDVLVLVMFGGGSLALTAGLLAAMPGLRALVRWGRPDVSTVALGLGGGVLVAAPVLALSLLSPVESRGGEVPLALLPALAFLALSGNLGEEVIFRGFLQGRLEQTMTPLRSALLSGVLFAACHAYLATTVTTVGWPLMLFTLYEGLICAFLRMRRGVIPATLAHGSGIFLLASGLV